MPDLAHYFKDTLQILNIWKRELITSIKMPTPIKIVNSFTTGSNGIIGGGLNNLSIAGTIWECPMSHEAWLHRINITSPQYTPISQLDTGQLLLFGSSGEIITWTPGGPGQQPVIGGTQGVVLPIAVEIEGRFSAPHLSPGERLLVVGDTLPSNVTIRFDLQINLVAGISPDTPIPFVGTSLAEHIPNGT